MEIGKQWVRWGIGIACVILFFTLLIRLADQAQMVETFPLDFVNDLSSYMAQLHFLKVCGFLEQCPYWYNGFVHLAVSPPGWYFFAYPFLLLSGSVTFATYASMVALFVLGLCASLFLARRLGLSRVSGVAFFCFVFANAMNVGNFTRLGRLHAFLVLVLSVLFVAIVVSYRNRKLDAKFLWAGVVYGLMMVTHYQETVLFGLLFVSILLTRTAWKERALVGLTGLVALLVASWWVVPFVRTLFAAESSLLAEWNFEGRRLLIFTPELGLTNILGIAVGISVLVCAWLLWKQKIWTRRDLVFFSPVLIFAGVFLARLPAFLPILKQISPDPYTVFFLVFAVLFFLWFVALGKMPAWARKGIAVGLILLAVVSAFVTLTVTPRFVGHSSVDKEVIGLLSDIEGRFLIFGSAVEGFNRPYGKATYAFAAVNYNLSTSEGWSQPLASSEYLVRLTELKRNFTALSCAELVGELRFFNTTDVITYRDTCNVFAQCGLQEIRKTESACLYRLA